MNVDQATLNYSPPNGWRVEHFAFGEWRSEEQIFGSLADVTVEVGADEVEEGAGMFYTLLAGNGDSYEVTPAPEGPFTPRTPDQARKDM